MCGLSIGASLLGLGPLLLELLEGEVHLGLGEVVDGKILHDAPLLRRSVHAAGEGVDETGGDPVAAVRGNRHAHPAAPRRSREPVRDVVTRRLQHAAAQLQLTMLPNQSLLGPRPLVHMVSWKGVVDPALAVSEGVGVL